MESTAVVQISPASCEALCKHAHTQKPPRDLRDTEVRAAVLFHAAPWKSSATDAWTHAEQITGARQSKTTAIRVSADSFQRVSVSSSLRGHVATRMTRSLIHRPLSKTHTIHLYFPARHAHISSIDRIAPFLWYTLHWPSVCYEMMRVCSARIDTFLSVSNVLPLVCPRQGFALQVIITKLN